MGPEAVVPVIAAMTAETAVAAPVVATTLATETVVAGAAVNTASTAENLVSSSVASVETGLAPESTAAGNFLDRFVDNIPEASLPDQARGILENIATLPDGVQFGNEPVAPGQSSTSLSAELFFKSTDNKDQKPTQTSNGLEASPFENTGTDQPADESENADPQENPDDPEQKDNKEEPEAAQEDSPEEDQEEKNNNTESEKYEQTIQKLDEVIEKKQQIKKFESAQEKLEEIYKDKVLPTEEQNALQASFKFMKDNVQQREVSISYLKNEIIQDLQKLDQGKLTADEIAALHIKLIQANIEMPSSSFN